MNRKKKNHNDQNKKAKKLKKIKNFVDERIVETSYEN